MIPVDWNSLLEPAPADARGIGPGHGAVLRNSRMVRIEWGDCDPAGIVFYPRYFAIFDASTAALFERALGLSKYQQLKTFDFAGYPLVRTRARFLKPTRFGDDLMVDTSISFGRSSFEIEHRISLDWRDLRGVLGDAGVGGARFRDRRPQIASAAGGGAGEVRQVKFFNARAAHTLSLSPRAGRGKRS